MFDVHRVLCRKSNLKGSTQFEVLSLVDVDSERIAVGKDQTMLIKGAHSNHSHIIAM